MCYNGIKKSKNGSRINLKGQKKELLIFHQKSYIEGSQVLNFATERTRDSNAFTSFVCLYVYMLLTNDSVSIYAE